MEEASGSIHQVLGLNNIYDDQKMILKSIYFIFTIVVFMLWTSPCIGGGGVLFIDASNDASTTKHKVERACQYYGLKTRSIIIKKNKPNISFVESMRQNIDEAIIITEKAFDSIDNNEAQILFENARNNNANILILGITDAVNSAMLEAWSKGSIAKCVRVNNSKELYYKVSDRQKDVTRELSGQEFKSQSYQTYYFSLPKKSKAQVIMGVHADGELFPTFIRIPLGRNSLYFQADIPSRISTEEIDSQQYGDYFLSISPLLMFLKCSLKDYCWHRQEGYANFTIDDPWLREPYGYLNYGGLLNEMAKADFHTTIAFVPWNFDRSEQQVVSLFRKYPERFSISFHGNNHDHREFYQHEKLADGSWPEKALTEQSKNIEQAIARMEQFSKKEGIPHDDVMVFPHQIPDGMTLHLLKKYNFLATVNTNNIPIGENQYQDANFFLRAVNLESSNFPSVRRFPASQLSNAVIARELFLDNPLIIYAHHEFFKRSISEFNKIATTVKQIKPNIKWASLGTIAKNLYLEKKIGTGNYDVYSFSNHIILSNKHKRMSKYYVRKDNTSYPTTLSILVDNKPYPFEITGNEVLIQLTLLSGETTEIEIQHAANYAIDTSSIHKKNLRVNILRMISDFRDIYLSKSFVGNMLVETYYYKQKGLEIGKIIISLSFIFLSAAIILLMRIIIKKRRSK